MAQHTDLVLPLTAYTRADYTALRAYCQKIPLARIASLYYSEESPQLSGGLERFLISMRAELIERSIVHNPTLAVSLQHVRQGGAISPKALDILVKAADLPTPVPQPSHRIAQWFRPKTAQALGSEGIHTISNLIDIMLRRGATWWRAVPRIGKHRAAVLENWVTQHATTLGILVLADKTPDLPTSTIERVFVGHDHAIPFVPFTLLDIPPHLDGSYGINREQQFSYINGKTDKDAIRDFLSRYVGEPHTYRAFYKELQRFFYFALLVAKKPLSSFLVKDCADYMAFIQDPPDAFKGRPAPLDSHLWRPFSLTPLSEKSQRQAITICRQLFAFWVGVRYLAGNPWIALKIPKPLKQVDAMQIEKALPDTLWKKLITTLNARAQHPDEKQLRVALAAILLMGDSGCRRNEVATALQRDLKPSQFATNVYELKVVGKGRKERIVPISPRTLAALRAHWADLDGVEDAGNGPPLLSPIVKLAIHPSIVKKPHVGYTPGALYTVIKVAIYHLIIDPAGPFTIEEIRHLEATTAHAFRHTFGTLAVARGIPVEVMQKMLGHESIGTTSIYVQAKKKQMVEEASAYFASLTNSDTLPSV